MSSLANNNRRLILASASARRKTLLASFDLPFDIVNADVDETVAVNEAPFDYVERVALLKAHSAANQHAQAYIIAADTTVTLNTEILSKPIDEMDAQRMLALLSGRQHHVLSSVVLIDPYGKVFQRTVKTKVWFVSLSKTLIKNYCATKEPFGKAGAYAIQGYGGRFVSKIDGSYSSVVGLPLYETSYLLQQAGFDCGYGILS